MQASSLWAKETQTILPVGQIYSRALVPMSLAEMFLLKHYYLLFLAIYLEVCFLPQVALRMEVEKEMSEKGIYKYCPGAACRVHGPLLHLHF